MAVKLGDPVEKSYGRDAINDRYHRYDKILGRGAYKTVYWGWDTAEGVDVAWNCIDLDALPTTEERSKILREVEMLQDLDHKHILRIRDHWENPQTNQLCFITDIVQGGSLREYIRQREVNLLRVKSWSIQILDALKYLHSSSPVIIHRDLKCDNIFIDGPSGNITIGDLGLSTKYASNAMLNNKEKGMSIVGTPEFMAPELYEEQYDEKVDIYSFGMCVLEMISKKYPYEECTNQIQVIRKVTEKKQPDILRRLHRYVRTFIEICIERNPKKRPSATELLKHPFLCFMDDLKNRCPVSVFVFEEDCTIKHYKDMENKSKHKQRQLSMIKEQITNRATSNSKSPSPKTNKNSSNVIKRTAKGSMNKKARTKKKYVSCIAVSVEDGGNICVKLKIHHDKESQKVKFQYNPQTEDIQSVVQEMVETLDLDRSREGEIVTAIKTKLKDIVTAPDSVPQRASTQPPVPHSPIQPTQANVAQMKTYSEPPSAKPPMAQMNNEAVKPKQMMLPKVFNANGTAAHLNTNNAATAIINRRNVVPSNNMIMNNMMQKPKSSTTQSAPVTPAHSPETEKHFINKFKSSTGYTSDTCSDFIREQDKNGPKLVSDSLLDQIMALPRETIKARIVQFGGGFSGEDSTAVLVTKLFQLLSDNSTKPTAATNNTNANGVHVMNNVTEDEQTPALVMQHIPHSNIQHVGSSSNLQQHNNLQLMAKMNAGAAYHAASTSESRHFTPPNIISPVARNHNTIQMIESQSPPNELVSHPPTQQTQSTVVVSPKLAPNHQRSQSYNSNIPLPQPPDHIEEEEPDELDPNIELPKLRLRQKELMKGKIVYEMERLKQRNCAQLGRDKTIDNIASELAQVEKQIKILTDASKTGTKIKHKKHHKTLSDSNINIANEDINHKEKDLHNNKKRKVNLQLNIGSLQHSRHNSSEIVHNINDSKRNEVSQLSIDHNVSLIGSVSNSGSHSVSLLVDTISSPLVSNAHRDQFDGHLQRLPAKLDLSEIAFNLDELFNLNENRVSLDVFQNAKDRIAREKKQLEEEYNQYYADQTEMLLLKLHKHKNNHNKLMSETQSTQNKLLSKQEKQRSKFKSIVNDQLQILQLTQELNDDTNAVNAPQTIVPQDEFYLYKEEIDKIYLERVKQFEAKQKKELDSFRTDLRELKNLRLEIHKKRIQSNPSSPQQQQSTIPHARSPHRLHFDDAHIAFQLPSSANSAISAVKQRKPNRAQHQSSATVPIDILTGLDIINNNDAKDIKDTAMHHFHSSSLPLTEHKQAVHHNHSHNHSQLTPTCVAPQSKFKVSHVNSSLSHPLHQHMHIQTLSQSLNNSFSDVNNIK